MTPPTITITSVPLHDGRTLHMKQPLVLEVEDDPEMAFRYSVSHDRLDIYAFGATMTDCEIDLRSEIVACWMVYGFLSTREGGADIAARWREIAEVREGGSDGPIIINILKEATAHESRIAQKLHCGRWGHQRANRRTGTIGSH